MAELARRLRRGRFHRGGAITLLLLAVLIGLASWAWTAKERNDLTIAIAVRATEHERFEVGLHTTDAAGRTRLLEPQVNVVHPYPMSHGVGWPVLGTRDGYRSDESPTHTRAVELGDLGPAARIQLDASSADDMRLSVVLERRGWDELTPGLLPARSEPLRASEWRSADWALLAPHPVQRFVKPAATVPVKWAVLGCGALIVALAMIRFFLDGAPVRRRYLSADYWLGPPL